MIEPLPVGSFASTISSPPERLAQWRTAGLSKIRDGKVAVILMAGGQGTRLGSSKPKGVLLGDTSECLAIRAYSRFRLSASFASKSGRVEGSERISLFRPSRQMSVISDPTYEATTSLTSEENQYFGPKRENVLVFQPGNFALF